MTYRNLNILEDGVVYRMSVRGANCLRNEDIKIADVASVDPAKIMHTPNFGKKSLVELAEIIQEHDLQGKYRPLWDQVALKKNAGAIECPTCGKPWGATHLRRVS